VVGSFKTNYRLVTVNFYFSPSAGSPACGSLQTQCWCGGIPCWQGSWCQHQRFMGCKWKRLLLFSSAVLGSSV